jgi:hypothetical protein
MTNSDQTRTLVSERGRWWAGLGVLVFAALALVVILSMGRMGEVPRIDPELSAARQVLLALTLYAADEPSAKIEKLDDLLVKGYLEDDSLIYGTASDGTKRARWVFLGYDPSQLGSTPVLISAEPHDGERAVGTNDTSVELMPESFFQTWARKQGIQTDAASAARK